MPWARLCLAKRTKESDAAWERLDSVLEVRAKLAEHVDYVWNAKLGQSLPECQIC